MRSLAEHPLRIAQVGTPFFPMPPEGYGGIESMMTDLVNGLIDRGHEVITIGVGQQGTKASRHITTFDQPQFPRMQQRWVEITHVAHVQSILHQLASEGTEVDIIHDHSAAGPLLAAGRRQPTVVTCHGPLVGPQDTDEHDIATFYHLMSHYADFVAISDAQRQLAPQISWSGMVHNALNVEAFPFQEEKEDYVMFLGKFYPYKGAHLAIDAAREAGQNIVLAGRCEEPEEQAYFEAEIVPRLGPDVDWVGPLSTGPKMDYLKRAKALLSPITRPEPFGLVMTEAMACGTPVVALRYGSVPEIVADEVTGIICEAVEELPSSLQRSFYLSPSACRKHVETNFSVESMAQGYEQVYRQALSR